MEETRPPAVRNETSQPAKERKEKEKNLVRQGKMWSSEKSATERGRIERIKRTARLVLFLSRKRQRTNAYIR